MIFLPKITSWLIDSFYKHKPYSYIRYCFTYEIYTKKTLTIFRLSSLREQSSTILTSTYLLTVEKNYNKRRHTCTPATPLKGYHHIFCVFSPVTKEKKKNTCFRHILLDFHKKLWRIFSFIWMHIKYKYEKMWK